MEALLADTSALVALLDRSDALHGWAVEIFKTLRPPLLVCEAVLAEASHLLEQAPPEREAAPVWRLLHKYRDVPMDFADACLVRMAELQHTPRIWTADADFHVYRRNGRQPIALIFPPDAGASLIESL
jgi:predicted nucleic acid-binding protein